MGGVSSTAIRPKKKDSGLGPAPPPLECWPALKGWRESWLVRDKRLTAQPPTGTLRSQPADNQSAVFQSLCFDFIWRSFEFVPIKKKTIAKFLWLNPLLLTGSEDSAAVACVASWSSRKSEPYFFVWLLFLCLCHSGHSLLVDYEECWKKSVVSGRSERLNLFSSGWRMRRKPNFLKKTCLNRLTV